MLSVLVILAFLASCSPQTAKSTDHRPMIIEHAGDCTFGRNFKQDEVLVPETTYKVMIMCFKPEETETWIGRFTHNPNFTNIKVERGYPSEAIISFEVVK